MKRASTRMKMNIDHHIKRMNSSSEPVFESAVTWHSVRVQVLQNGKWVHPTYLPVYKSRDEAFKACVCGFPLGQARVVLMKFINDDLIEEIPAPQREFLYHCVKWGKI